MERDVSGGGGKVPIIVAAAVALAGLITLVTGSLGQLLCLLFQQFIQRFFDAAEYSSPREPGIRKNGNRNSGRA